MIWKGSQDSVERAIRSATFGMIFGIIFGASNVGVIRDRQRAALVGLLGGVIASPMYWVSACIMGEEIAVRVRGQGILLSLLLFGASGFVTGVLYGVLFYDKRENELGG